MYTLAQRYGEGHEGCVCVCVLMCAYMCVYVCLCMHNWRRFMIDVCLCYALTEDGYTPCPTVDNRQTAVCVLPHLGQIEGMGKGT